MSSTSILTNSPFNRSGLRDITDIQNLIVKNVDKPFNFDSFRHFLMKYSLIAFAYLYGVASVCIKIFKL